jgi:predicted glycosyltransferase
MSGSTEARLLIYSQDGLGLGHLRRTTLLAQEFLKARPYASTLTISDSPLGQFFSTAKGHDYLKLPSIKKAAPGSWLPIALSSPFADVLAMRKEIIRSTVREFAPQLLLVDHMPRGAMGELVPALEELDPDRVRVVLGLRDILDGPETIRQRWRLEGAFEAVERHYHDVLVYGSRDVFDVAEQYAWPTRASHRLRYCGYVCAPPATQTQARRLRARYLRDLPGAALIVVMAGGGADAYPLFDTVLSAVPRLTASRPCVVVLVTGPFLPPVQRQSLAQRARHQPVRMLRSVTDSLSYLAAADLVVAMAGYNTTTEILRVGTRAVLVPRRGPSAEQQTRARLFADRGWVRWLPPDRLDPQALADSVLGALADGIDLPRPGPDLGGREAAARRLLRALEGVDGSANGQAGYPLDPPLLAGGQPTASGG